MSCARTLLPDLRAAIDGARGSGNVAKVVIVMA